MRMDLVSEMSGNKLYSPRLNDMASRQVFEGRAWQHERTSKT